MEEWDLDLGALIQKFKFLAPKKCHLYNWIQNKTVSYWKRASYIYTASMEFLSNYFLDILDLWQLTDKLEYC